MIASQIQQAAAELQSVQQQGVVLEQNITQMRKVELFVTRDRFTRRELYEWLRGRMTGLYFQSYQLAHQVAQGAQWAWQFERGHSQEILTNGYWENLYQGLLAGESLSLDLLRLEQAYMQQDARRLELVKTLSLTNSAIAIDEQGQFVDLLEELRSRRSIMFTLSPRLFDADFPGHYLRQINSLSITFPAVSSAYENFNATLRQVNDHTLLIPDADVAVEMLTNVRSNPQIRSNFRNNREAVAFSRGINDSGLFQLNFNDPRYLPFEGTGAISTWQLDLAPSISDQTLASLTDVVIELRYTAVDGGNALRNAVIAELGRLASSATDNGAPDNSN